MLLEQETELLITTQYENYLDSGGKLPEQEYNVVSMILSQPYLFKLNGRVSQYQILSILQKCGLETSEREILAYDVLRDRMHCEEEVSKRVGERSKCVWCMGDQELVREIVFLSDETGEKYRVMTESFPNIFGE
jgi:hypothetical protein